MTLEAGRTQKGKIFEKLDKKVSFFVIMFALPKHIANEMAIKSHYILQKMSTNFDKRQFKSNQTKNTKIYNKKF